VWRKLARRAGLSVYAADIRFVARTFRPACPPPSAWGGLSVRRGGYQFFDADLRSVMRDIQFLSPTFRRTRRTLGPWRGLAVQGVGLKVFDVDMDAQPVVPGAAFLVRNVNSTRLTLLLSAGCPSCSSEVKAQFVMPGAVGFCRTLVGLRHGVCRRPIPAIPPNGLLTHFQFGSGRRHPPRRP
jgi:hypothetical protein